jgi:hypothetical protein
MPKYDMWEWSLSDYRRLYRLCLMAKAHIKCRDVPTHVKWEWNERLQKSVMHLTYWEGIMDLCKAYDHPDPAMRALYRNQYIDWRNEASTEKAEDQENVYPIILPREEGEAVVPTGPMITCIEDIRAMPVCNSWDSDFEV